MAGSVGVLVEQIKGLQAKDEASGEEVAHQWSAYVRQHGRADMDPTMHDYAFLHKFVEDYVAGVRLPTLGADFATLVKQLQKSSASFTKLWQNFVTKHGTAMSVLGHVDLCLYEMFMDSLACKATGQGEGHLLRNHLDTIGQSPPKRMKAAVDLREKDLLAGLVNSFRQLGEEQREKWIRHAELHHGGISDPSQHHVASLQIFCNFHGLGSSNAASSGSGTNIAAGPPVPFVASTRSIPVKAATPPKPVVVPPPTSAQLELVRKGAPTLGTGDAERDGLIVSIKAFQAAGDAQHEQWARFCEANNGGITDPRFHDTAALEAFMSQICVTAPILSTAQSLGTNDPLKAALVKKVKMFQRVNPALHELWQAYAGKMKDPSRHEVGFLQEFCRKYNIT